MAVSRLSDKARGSAAIWPGFVDAMTALLLVLMFVLSIFMLVQFVLRTQITGQEQVIEEQERRLGDLSAQLAGLSNVLAMEVTRAEELDRELGVARATIIEREAELDAATDLAAGLAEERTALRGRVADFETQVASLLAERSALEGRVAALEGEVAEEIDAKEALALALARARDEIDAGTEEARRAAAEREALEALIADLNADMAAGDRAISALEADRAANLALIAALEAERVAAQAETAEERAARDAALARIGALETELTEEERLRLASIAAAEALRARLREADAEITAMTLALEERRREAEETLTLLAAAEAAKREAEEAGAALSEQLSAEEAERRRQEALLALARSTLAEREDAVSDQAKELALLNEQAAELRAQLAQLSAQLDASEARDREAGVEIANLGSRLNAALAREAQLQAREAERLRAEKESLEAYRSEFFGEMRKVLGDREEIRIVGDRFVFQSEVLFDTGSADLGFEGRRELSRLGGALREVIDRIPEGIEWLLVAEGHTDDVPLSGAGEFRDNWELSQGRALSVVRYLTDFEGLPPERLAALGYGEFQPLDTAGTPEARARNRRIELKFTERPARGGG